MGLVLNFTIKIKNKAITGILVINNYMITKNK